jgi:hypothetical protein
MAWVSRFDYISTFRQLSKRESVHIVLLPPTFIISYGDGHEPIDCSVHVFRLVRAELNQLKSFRFEELREASG